MAVTSDRIYFYRLHSINLKEMLDVLNALWSYPVIQNPQSINMAQACDLPCTAMRILGYLELPNCFVEFVTMIDPEWLSVRRVQR